MTKRLPIDEFKKIEKQAQIFFKKQARLTKENNQLKDRLTKTQNQLEEYKKNSEINNINLEQKYQTILDEKENYFTTTQNNLIEENKRIINEIITKNNQENAQILNQHQQEINQKNQLIKQLEQENNILVARILGKED